MNERTILHVDMDAFFASVEVMDDPALRGKPVIVGGTPEGRGVVSAASYEARAFGVRSAMSAARAIRLCPGGVFLRPRMKRYLEISRSVFGIFNEFTPLVEPVSVDEAFLDLSGCERLHGSGTRAGILIKQAILDRVGLVASVGVAPNKFLAKLASDHEKPDGFVVVAPGTEAAWLAALPIGRMWGVGPRTAGLLEGIGVRFVRDLFRRPRTELRRVMGDHGADRLLRLARGVDDRPVVTDHAARSIGNESTFARDIADPDELQEILDTLAEKVAWRLRRAGVRARTLCLKARYADFTTVTRSSTLERPMNATRDVRDAARDLLRNRLGRSGRALRLVGVTAQGLDRGAGRQGELFPDEAARREKTLDDVVDRLTERYGSGILRRGTSGRDGSES